MKLVILALGVLLLASCCPKIVETTTTTSKRDSITIYKTDTVEVPARVDTFALPLDYICDSLRRREASFRMESNEGVSVEIRIDSVGQASIITGCDSLQLIIDSLSTETFVTDTVTVTNTKTVYVKPKGGKLKWFFIGVGVGFILTLIGIIAIRR